MILDPPFLSAECFAKTAETVRHVMSPTTKVLACTGASVAAPASGRAWVPASALSALGASSLSRGVRPVAGAVMAEVVARELGLWLCAYRPGHSSKLSNEFRCYANFDDPALGREPTAAPTPSS